MWDLNGKAALVTGGSRGLGKAIVLELARMGADVAYCYKKDAQAAEAVADQVEEENGRRPFYIQADITDEKDRARLMKEAPEQLGGLHVLVNNAGTRADGVAIRMNSAWDQVIDLDLNAPFRLAQYALRTMMKQSWGRIINIGSIASRIGLGGQANYAAAKAGLEGLTRSLAQEYGKRGITVNTVNPGFLETDLTGDASLEFRMSLIGGAAVPRTLTPDAIANVVAFLSSDAAWAITGQSINVDCGLVKL